MKKVKCVLKKDLIIPAGTELIDAPSNIAFHSDHKEALVGFGVNHCASMYFDIDLIKEHPDQFILDSCEDQ